MECNELDAGELEILSLWIDLIDIWWIILWIRSYIYNVMIIAELDHIITI